MSELSLSSLLVSEGLLTADELAALREALAPGASLEDALLERGLITPETLGRLLSLASTPPPSESHARVVRDATPAHGETVWEYEAPILDELREDLEDVSPDAPTGRYGNGRVSKTTRWDQPLLEEGPAQPSGKTTRWEVPVPLPSDEPTGLWHAPGAGSGRRTARLDDAEEFDDLDDLGDLGGRDLSETVVDLPDPEGPEGPE